MGFIYLIVTAVTFYFAFVGIKKLGFQGGIIPRAFIFGIILFSSIAVINGIDEGISKSNAKSAKKEATELKAKQFTLDSLFYKNAIIEEQDLGRLHQLMAIKGYFITNKEKNTSITKRYCKLSLQVANTDVKTQLKNKNYTSIPQSVSDHTQKCKSKITRIKTLTSRYDRYQKKQRKIALKNKLLNRWKKCFSGDYFTKKYSVESYLRGYLKDPDSYSFITAIPYNEKGNSYIEFKYRARNGFGGMTIGELVLLVTSDSCELLPVK